MLLTCLSVAWVVSVELFLPGWLKTVPEIWSTCPGLLDSLLKISYSSESLKLRDAPSRHSRAMSPSSAMLSVPFRVHGCLSLESFRCLWSYGYVANCIPHAQDPVKTDFPCVQDGKLDEMSISDWEAAVKPKVDGTWNLHKATQSIPLDFMVMFSSFSGLVGQRGQANYASANTFLDAFVQYRHANGLAASVLDIGPIEDVSNPSYYYPQDPGHPLTGIAALDRLRQHEQNGPRSIQGDKSACPTRDRPA